MWSKVMTQAPGQNPFASIMERNGFSSRDSRMEEEDLEQGQEQEGLLFDIMRASVLL